MNCVGRAGVARQSHKLQVVGSIPTPATSSYLRAAVKTARGTPSPRARCRDLGEVGTAQKRGMLCQEPHVSINSPAKATRSNRERLPVMGRGKAVKSDAALRVGAAGGANAPASHPGAETAGIRDHGGSSVAGRSDAVAALPGAIPPKTG